MSKTKTFEISLIAAFLIAIIFSICGFAETCKDVRSDVLRLHVIANSDDEADQSLKLKVRDAVLHAGKNVFDGSVTRENAQKKIEEEKDALTEAALKTIKNNGFDYPVKISVTEEYFTTRTYDDKYTLPAGKYTAVRVVIGEGKGHNWWCVMFPPLCLPAAQKNTDVDLFLNNKEVKLIKNNPKYEPRFKIVELIEDLKNKFTNK